MDEITGVLVNSMNNVLIQLIKWLGISVVAYFGTFIILRLIKIPKGVSNFIVFIEFAVVIYKTFINGNL